MIKVCSLDFLNRDVFDTDVMSSDGKVIFRNKDKVTSGILLSLYFQEIFVERDLYETAKEENLVREQAKQEQQKQELLKQELQKQEQELQKQAAASKSMHKIEPKAEEAKPSETVEEEPKLVFDEDRATKIANYASLMGKAIGLAPEKLKELEQVAHYYDIGRKRLTESALLKKDFKQIQAKESYDILSKEMEFPAHMAEVAHLYLNSYESKEFKLEKSNGCEIPYHHIVAIADYYDELLKKYPKEEVLLKMLILGGNRFNIFVLHKFINIMRRSND